MRCVNSRMRKLNFFKYFLYKFYIFLLCFFFLTIRILEMDGMQKDNNKTDKFERKMKSQQRVAKTTQNNFLKQITGF